MRIEDDFYVDQDGKLIKLSAALPSKAEDVEKEMDGKVKKQLSNCATG